KKDDIKRAKDIGIIASMQPIHCVKDRDVAYKFWGDRCKGSAYVWKTVLKEGIPLAFGTDVPVETLNPFYSIYTAVVRHDIGEETPWYPEERLTLYEAFSAYTKGSSYAEKKENIKGTIEVGKLADFLILEEDPFNIDIEELYKLKPMATIVGGSIKIGNI
ncbi:MAG TPA: amidohydrolase, partial [Candidatus Atribacteria bacterium]|nr:amidohydrolase [Candidatus Atribacteria bacterium]